MSVPALDLALNEDLSAEIGRAVVDAMKFTFSEDVVPGKYEVGEGPVVLSGDVSGVIGMVQNDLEGTLTLCFHEETMCKILPRIVGEQAKVTHAMTLDAVSEITNMIFGHIKNALNSRGYQIKLGIPSVISGRGQFLSHFHRGKYLVMPFQLGDKQFQVHIAVHQHPVH